LYITSSEEEVGQLKHEVVEAPTLLRGPARGRERGEGRSRRQLKQRKGK
jgi:hypothetical protein